MMLNKSGAFTFHKAVFWLYGYAIHFLIRRMLTGGRRGG